MEQVNSCGQGLAAGPYTLSQAGKWNGFSAESLILFGCDVAFLFPEGVEDTDQRCALTGKVMQIEQLESAKAGSSHHRLDLFLVTDRLKLTR